MKYAYKNIVYVMLGLSIVGCGSAALAKIVCAGYHENTSLTIEQVASGTVKVTDIYSGHIEAQFLADWNIRSLCQTPNPTYYSPPHILNGYLYLNPLVKDKYLGSNLSGALNYDYEFVCPSGTQVYARGRDLKAGWPSPVGMTIYGFCKNQ